MIAIPKGRVKALLERCVPSVDERVDVPVYLSARGEQAWGDLRVALDE